MRKIYKIISVKFIEIGSEIMSWQFFDKSIGKSSKINFSQ